MPPLESSRTIGSQMLAYYLDDLDPIIFRIYDNVGPRWYGLSYVLAFISSFVLFLSLAKRGYADLPVERVGDFITGAALFGGGNKNAPLVAAVCERRNASRGYRDNVFVRRMPLIRPVRMEQCG